MEASSPNPVTLDTWLKRWNPKLPLQGAKEAFRFLGEGLPPAHIAFAKSDEVAGIDLKTVHELQDKRVEWENFERRKEQILKDVEQQGKLTPEFREQVERTYDSDRLEDIFMPYRSKRQTLGVLAAEAGLTPLANYVWHTAHGEPAEEIPGETLLDKAKNFVKPDTRYADPESVLKGVTDMLVERIAESPELRAHVRSAVFRRSKLRSEKGPKAKPNSKYTKYFHYQEPIGSLKKGGAGYRYLMIRKGWMEDELAVSFERPDEGVLLEEFEKFAAPNKETIGAELLLQAARLALKGNVYTAVENEAHRSLREGAEAALTRSIAEAFRFKVLRAPFGPRPVLGVVPVAAGDDFTANFAFLDGSGKLVLQVAQKLSETNDEWENDLVKSLQNLQTELVVVAHGPGFTKIRTLFKKIQEKLGKELPVVSVHEPIAGIYSSCPAGKEDFPDLDPAARKAAFLGRYVQDPLSALVRLDFKFFSINELQHEIPQPMLRRALQRVLEECVALLGVDLNFAPVALISRVPGMNLDLAKAIVAERENKGKFTSLEDLKRVPGISERAFEISQDFFVLRESAKPLERIPMPGKVRAVFESALESSDWQNGLSDEAKQSLFEKLSTQGLGEFVLKNALDTVARGEKDPRGTFTPPALDPELWSITDLKPDRPYEGVITNVTTFGVFVDLGIDQDGLIHISQLPIESARNLFDSFYPGAQGRVWVTQVNAEKQQISLSLRDPAERQARPPRRRPQGEKRGERRPPRRRPEAPMEGQPQAAAGEHPQPQEGMQDRPRREHRRRRDGEMRGRSDKERKPKVPKKPDRDPKTGAVVRREDDYRHTGPRLPTRAKPTTFNPFANLATILKNKETPKE